LVYPVSHDIPNPSEPADVQACQHELDLALAVELQAALMPANWTIDCRNYQAAALNRMSGRVGGDFCEFIRLNADQVAAVVGDVDGHGVRASLLMARIMGLLRSRPPECSRPQAIVGNVNEMLLDLGDKLGTPMTCSLFYVVLDSPTNTAFFVNAGLPLPILSDRRSGLAIRLGPEGSPLGVRDFVVTEDCHTFTPSERLTICTDGVHRAANCKDKPFGIDRLETVLGHFTQASANACVHAIFAAVDKFRQAARQRDDETVLIIDRL